MRRTTMGRVLFYAGIALVVLVVLFLVWFVLGLPVGESTEGGRAY